MISNLLPVLLLPLALAAPAPSSDSYPSPKSCAKISAPDKPVDIIPKGILPVYYNALPTSTQSTAPILNQLALTAVATDSKNFTALGELFAENAAAQLAAQDSGFLQGRDAILEVYEKALANFETQISYGTTFAKIYPDPPPVEGEEESFFNPGGCQASTYTYFTTTFFERGNFMGKRAIVVGDFRDRWVNDNGVWKILLRIQTITGMAYDGGLDFS